MSPVFYEQRSETVFLGPICDHPFPAHVHDVVEIVCLQAGDVQMLIGGQVHSLKAGDIAVAFPAIPHSYEVVSEDARGLTLIFLPDTISEFNTRFRTNVPVTPVVTGRKKASELDFIIGQLQKVAQQEDSPLKLGYLHLFLSYLFTCMVMRPVGNRSQSGLPYQVLHYISEHFTEQLSLESTAKALGISRTHLSHIFSQQLRINFRQYINTLRIDRACTLLRDPAYSISQITDLCGYGNPRTFHRAFLAQCHMPPNQYRARMLGTAEEE
ncbi:MAG: helix-turn-helix domain-containing protein [Clostridia bacterium]|nr:helix-turn-helix domain-containing protein [Clostridia bacterium]